MRFQSRREQLTGPIGRAFEASLRDGLQYAAAHAPGGAGGAIGRSGRIERRNDREGFVGFTHPGAHAQEVGATIRPKAPRQVLHFQVRPGQWRTEHVVHLRPRPYLRPMGEQWPDMFSRRLREASR